MNPWIENLISRQNKGEQLDFLFFWGHRPKADGSISKSCFSQWYDHGFTQNDEYFRTAEHWMMAAKAELFGDEQVRKAILAARTPLEAKKLGRKVRGFDQKRWDEAKFDLVVEGNQLKFSQNPKFKDFLLSTSGRYWWKLLRTILSGESVWLPMILVLRILSNGQVEIYWDLR